jgi:hypothetical protein
MRVLHRPFFSSAMLRSSQPTGALAAHRFANVIAKTVTGKQKSGRFDGPLFLHLFVNR